MIATTRLLTVVSSLLVLTLFARAGDEPAPPRRVLILTNESTFAGVIEREDAGYRVKNETGELVIPAKQVLRVCANLEEAYELLKGRANLRDPHERLRLARWCWNQNLLDQARAEADAALQLAPKFLDAQRLVRALADARPALPSSKASRSSGSGTSFAAGDSADAPARAQRPKPLAEHSYSQETLQTFTRKVQPILFNSCGTGQCHAGGRVPGFELQRPFASGSLPAQMTRQNLLHTLNLLDKDDPAGSMLLRKALERHGGGARAPLAGKDSPAYQALEAWVLSTCGAKLGTPMLEETPKKEKETEGEIERTIGFAGSRAPREQPANISPPSTAPTVPLRPRVTIGPDGRPMIEPPAPPVQTPTSRVPGEPGASPAKRPAGTPVFHGGEVVGASAPETKDPKSKLPDPLPKPPKEPPKPVDPFDPAQFNRQHHPERQ